MTCTNWPVGAGRRRLGNLPVYQGASKAKPAKGGDVPCQREDPQPETNSPQLWLAAKCGSLCVGLRREAESKKTFLEESMGGEPKILAEI